MPFKNIIADGFMKRFFATSPKRKLRVYSAWFVILAMLAQIFVPVGSTLASITSDGSDKIFVCTVNGIQEISLDGDGVPVEQAVKSSCSFCILHFTSIPSGQSLETFKVPFATVTLRVAWSPVSQSPSTIWRVTPGPSRAPPSSV